MQPAYSFDPQAVSMLSIVAEIEAEYNAKGQPLSVDAMEWMAHKLMESASLGETDREVLKARALLDM